MGFIQNGSFISAYYGDQIDALLAAMAQANPLPSGTNWVAFIDDCRAAQNAAIAAKNTAENAANSANSSSSTAQNKAREATEKASQALSSAEDSAIYARNALASSQSAAQSATNASISESNANSSASYASSKASEASTWASRAESAAGSAAAEAASQAAMQTADQIRSEMQGYATEAESWAVGGTGTRPGENTDNSEYYCNQARAAAEQASVPPVAGVYNIVLADRVTGAKYALVVYNGRLTAVGVAQSTEATAMTLVDAGTGKNYTLAANNGRICLQEV